MGDLTIRNIDDDLVRRLETRAAANGRSLDEEIRMALERVDSEVAVASEKTSDDDAELAWMKRMLVAGGGVAMPTSPGDEEYRAHLRRMSELGRPHSFSKPSEKEIERRMQLLKSISRKPDEPFDQKAITDELWSFME